jgi:cold shock CspA family protein
MPSGGLLSTFESHMSRDYFYGVTPRNGPKRPGKGPPNLHGKAVRGRIVTLLVGQGHGFIRLPNEREVYFHRADLEEGTAFNDLQVGQAVSFELLDDAVSGARALRVKRHTRPR